VITAGEQLQITPAIKQLFSQNPHATLINQYGPSETHVVTVYPMRGSAVDWPLLPPIGQPIPNNQVYVLDEAMMPVSVGVAGELYLGGAGLARGYWGRADLTAERFLPDPFAKRQGSRLYRTGDLASWTADGNLEFLGRMDHQVKIRGFRIELGEIEAALESHEDIAQAVVVAQEEVPGEKRLAGYVVPKAGSAELNTGRLRAYLKEKLPEYMVPVNYVVLEKLPLTPSGKVNRKALPAIEPDKKMTASPRNIGEELLCGIWEEVLKRPQIGIDENFFDLGGHSLLATQVVARIRGAFSVEIPLRTLFESPTVGELVASIENEKRAGRRSQIPALRPVERSESLPLSYAAQRLWFLDQMEPGNATYNLPWAVRLKGRLNKEALWWSIAEILRRNEVMRTCFPERNGVPVQEVMEPWAVEANDVDLRGVEPEKRETAALELARAEAETGFDLGRGPLWRVKLLQMEEQEHILLMTMHHIVSDGWSFWVILQEFAALYEGRDIGQAPRLADLPVQYADYAVWQRGWLQ